MYNFLLTKTSKSQINYNNINKTYISEYSFVNNFLLLFQRFSNLTDAIREFEVVCVPLPACA